MSFWDFLKNVGCLSTHMGLTRVNKAHTKITKHVCFSARTKESCKISRKTLTEMNVPSLGGCWRSRKICKQRKRFKTLLRLLSYSQNLRSQSCSTSVTMFSQLRNKKQSPVCVVFPRRVKSSEELHELVNFIFHEQFIKNEDKEIPPGHTLSCLE